MSISFRSSRKKRDFWGEDNELSSLCFKKTRHLPPEGCNLQGCPENKNGLFIALRDQFPMLDDKTIASVLETYGDNLQMAIEKLSQLQLTGQAPRQTSVEISTAVTSPQNSGSSEPSCLQEARLSSRWLDTILQELYKSESPEDSRRRLDTMLNAFEDAVIEHYKENSEEIKAAKEEFAKMRKNNGILCRALTHKQERLKAQDQELAKVRDMLVRAEERIRSLEMSNFALTLHLDKAIGPKANDHGAPPDIY